MTEAPAKILQSKQNLGLILGLSLGLAVPVTLMIFAAGICLYIKRALQTEDLHAIELRDYGAMENTENPFVEAPYSVENENAATNIPLSAMSP